MDQGCIARLPWERGGVSRAVQIDYEPFARQERDRSGRYSTLWPARWVSCPSAGSPPFVSAYRLRFPLPEPGHPAAFMSPRMNGTTFSLMGSGSDVGRTR